MQKKLHPDTISCTRETHKVQTFVNMTQILVPVDSCIRGDLMQTWTVCLLGLVNIQECSCRDQLSCARAE